MTKKYQKKKRTRGWGTITAGIEQKLESTGERISKTKNNISYPMRFKRSTRFRNLENDRPYQSWNKASNKPSQENLIVLLKKNIPGAGACKNAYFRA